MHWSPGPYLRVDFPGLPRSVDQVEIGRRARGRPAPRRDSRPRPSGQSRRSTPGEGDRPSDFFLASESRPHASGGSVNPRLHPLCTEAQHFADLVERQIEVEVHEQDQSLAVVSRRMACSRSTLCDAWCSGLGPSEPPRGSASRTTFHQRPRRRDRASLATIVRYQGRRLVVSLLTLPIARQALKVAS